MPNPLPTKIPDTIVHTCPDCDQDLIFWIDERDGLPIHKWKCRVCGFIHQKRSKLVKKRLIIEKKVETATVA